MEDLKKIGGAGGRAEKEEKQTVESFCCHVQLAASTVGTQEGEGGRERERERNKKEKGRKKKKKKKKNQFQPKPGILQDIIVQLIEKPLNKKVV